MTKFYLIVMLILVAFSARSQNINAAEYFIDTDPGLGNATPVAGFPNQLNVSNFPFQVSNLPDSGTHIVGYRTKDANNKWSHTNFTTFNIIENQVIGVITSLDYFWDADAGFGNNSTYTMPFPGTDIFEHQFDADVPAGLTVGMHSFFIRSMDSGNRYSHTNYKFDIDVVVLGVNDFEHTGIGVYPNPVANDLNVTIANNEKCRVIIYDMTGKVMIDTNITGLSKLDVSSYPRGVYTAYFWKDSNKIHVMKLIKE